MKKNVFILFFVFIALLKTEAQTVRFTETITDKSKIKSTASTNNSSVMQLVAAVNSNTSPTITIDYTIKLEIVHQNQEQKLKVFVQINSLKSSATYKGFPISDIYPSQVSFNLKHLKNGEAIQTYVGSDIEVQGLSTAAVSKSVTVEQYPDPTGAKSPSYKLEISDINFIYSKKDKDELDKKIKNIEKYYSASANIQTAINKVDKIKIDKANLLAMDNLEDFLDYKSFATENIGTCNKLKSEGFFAALSVGSNDPEDLKGKSELLKIKSTELLKNSEEIISQFDELFYLKGMDMLKVNKTQMAQFYFNKSISYNSKYAPSHYQIAKINYDNDNYTGALEIIDKILKMTPDTKTLGLTNDLTNIIYSDYVDFADSYNTRKDYDNALTWLNSARELCNKYNAITCSPAMETAYQTAHNGKYQTLLANTDAAYRLNKLSDAETTLDIASKYQITNKTYIPNNDEIVKRHNDILLKYISNADLSFASKKYDKALEDYLNAQRVGKSASYLTAPEDLTQKIFNTRTAIYTEKVDKAHTAYKDNNLDLAESIIAEANTYQRTYYLTTDTRIDKLVIDIKQTRYNKHIADALSKVEVRDYETALTFFTKAKEIQKGYAITPNAKLDNYYYDAAKALTLQKIEEGEKKVNINDLAAARALYMRANELKIKYELSADKDVTAAITALNDKIFQQECLNYRAEYDDHYKKAVNYIFTLDYIAADTELKLASEVTSKHPECMIDATNATYKKKEIEDAVIYQTAIKEANQEVSKGSYSTAINKYLEAQYLHTNKELEENFGLTHTELYDYIAQNKNEFIYFAVKYYIDDKQIQKSLTLLQLLQKKAYPKKYTKINQIYLGSELATYDHADNPNLIVKEKITEYTADDSWYKYFAKAYKTQVKKLSK